MINLKIDPEFQSQIPPLTDDESAYENAGGRAQKFLKLTERHAAFTDLTPAILNEFISRIEVHGLHAAFQSALR